MDYRAINHVLAVGAHPDDIEISCGGTMARYSRDGKKVTFLTVTNGDKGSFDIDPVSLAKIRKYECVAAASVIGAEWISLEIPDGTVIWDQDLHKRMINIIQDINPDIIFTHASNDYMSDHVETSKAILNASFYTVCPQFCSAAVGKQPCSKVAPVYFMDTLCGIGFMPQEYVDITDTLQKKLEMYSKHESQHKYLFKREKVDFFDVIRTSAHYRGLQCGVEYAEAFYRYAAWSRLSCGHRLFPGQEVG